MIFTAAYQSLQEGGVQWTYRCLWKEWSDDQGGEMIQDAVTMRVEGEAGE